MIKHLETTQRDRKSGDQEALGCQRGFHPLEPQSRFGDKVLEN